MLPMGYPFLYDMDADSEWSKVLDGRVAFISSHADGVCSARLKEQESVSVNEN